MRLGHFDPCAGQQRREAAHGGFFAVHKEGRLRGRVGMPGHELGLVKEGYLAALILVDGDPLSNLAILREPARMLAVMKDGVFYKTPEIRSARSRYATTAA